MSKFLFFAFAWLLTLEVTAQTRSDSIIFKVNDNGFFKTETGTNYYVISFAGKKAHDLYNDILCRLARSFKSPENVTEKMVEDRAVVVNAQVNELVEAYGGVREWFDFFYRFEFNFKDGKIRVLRALRAREVDSVEVRQRRAANEGTLEFVRANKGCFVR